MFNDIRDVTYKARVDIGFMNDRSWWREAPAWFSENALEIAGHSVMEEWERDYMRILAEIACSRGGVVLEVGFGMGISAEFIQSHNIKAHIIIESNRAVFSRLREFAKRRPATITALFGFWQDVSASLPPQSLNGILFDTYPITEGEIHRNHFSFFSEAWRLLSPGGILTYYSDEIADFSEQHHGLLLEAGFTSIRKQIVNVNPPHNCNYWKSSTIVAPIIQK